MHLFTFEPGDGVSYRTSPLPTLTPYLRARWGARVDEVWPAPAEAASEAP